MAWLIWFSNGGFLGIINCRWGELESGHTTIAFTPRHQHETDDLTGAVQVPKSDSERPPVEICLVYTDVDAAFKVCRQQINNGVSYFN